MKIRFDSRNFIFFSTMFITTSSILKLKCPNCLLRRSRSLASYCKQHHEKASEEFHFHPVEDKVLSCLNYQCKIKPNSYVLMAVSGGIDSMAMLHIMKRISEVFNLRLEVVTFNHKLRLEADEEVIYMIFARFPSNNILMSK